MFRAHGGLTRTACRSLTASSHTLVMSLLRDNYPDTEGFSMGLLVSIVLASRPVMPSRFTVSVSSMANNFARLDISSVWV